jgi:hypothetical protein
MTTDAVERVRRELEPKIRDIVEESGAMTFQYALDQMTTDYFEGGEVSLGRSIIYGQGTLLFFAASAAVALNAILNVRDADEDTADEAAKQLEDSFEKLVEANKRLLEAEETFLGGHVDA